MARPPWERAGAWRRPTEPRPDPKPRDAMPQGGMGERMGSKGWSGCSRLDSTRLSQKESGACHTSSRSHAASEAEKNQRGSSPRSRRNLTDVESLSLTNPALADSQHFGVGLPRVGEVRIAVKQYNRPAAIALLLCSWLSSHAEGQASSAVTRAIASSKHVRLQLGP